MQVQKQGKFWVIIFDNNVTYEKNPLSLFL
jgi:hypothetical protein